MKIHLNNLLYPVKEKTHHLQSQDTENINEDRAAFLLNNWNMRLSTWTYDNLL